MYISEIKNISNNKNKLKVIIDDKIELFLYTKEVQRLKLLVDQRIDDSIYNDLIIILSKRALKYCGYLLKERDYSVLMLTNKLKMKKYPTECINYAIDFLLDKKYLDDKRFARNYCIEKQNIFGKFRIKNELYQKGIDSDMVDEIFQELLDEAEDISESEIIKMYAIKKNFDIENADIKQKNRFYKFLLRKGINYNSISEYFSDYI